MKTRIITLYLLFIHLLFAGCSKEEAIDNVDPDVPDVEISEEEMEIAIQNLERVDQKMQPLFQASENLDDLAQHLDEIKAMEGVEDAWVGEDEMTLWVQIENGGKIFYHYPMVDVELKTLTMVSNLEKQLRNMTTIGQTDRSVCIINQTSSDYRFAHIKKECERLRQTFQEKGFKVMDHVVEKEEFTVEFLTDEMPKYDVIFMISHGMIQENASTEAPFFLITGEQVQTNEERLYWQELVTEGLAYPGHVDERDAQGRKDTIKYISVNSEYLKRSKEYKENRSILFNSACCSLKEGESLWEVLSSRKLGCYLGFDDIISSSKAINAATDFFGRLFTGITVSKAFNTMPDDLKKNLESRGEKGKRYSADLHCYPSDCQITLFDKLEITDEEVVDLGLSVKWRSMNLGASSYLELGRTYTLKEFMEIRRKLDNLGYDNREPVDISGTEYDFATQTLGAGWRMPTMKDWKELKSECEWKALIQDGVPGFRVTGTNGKSIFLPCTVYIEVEGSELFRTCYASGLINEHWDVESMWLIGNVASIGISGGTQQELEMIDEAFIRPVCD